METQRLVLRSFTPADFDDLYRLLYADEEVARWWTGRTCDREDVWERFTTEPVWRLRGGYGFRALVRKGDGVFLGLMGFQRFEPDEDLSYVELPSHVQPIGAEGIDAELTYAVGRQYQRQGYASEAAAGMLELGFRDPAIARVINIVDSRNTGTIALMQRFGFAFVPNLRSSRDWPSVVGILERPQLAEPTVSRSHCESSSQG